MRGTGTQADPLIPESIPEFKQAIATQDAYVKLDRDFDFNNNDTLWLWEYMDFSCSELDGNGYKLTNCYCYNKALFYFHNTTYNCPAPKICRNLIIEAIYISLTSDVDGGTQSFIGYSGWLWSNDDYLYAYFYDCDFRIKYYPLKNDNRMIGGWTSWAKRCGLYIRRCIFNIDVYTGQYEHISIFNNYQGSCDMQIAYCEFNVNICMCNTKAAASTNNNRPLRGDISIFNFTNVTVDNDAPILNCAVFINVYGVDISSSDTQLVIPCASTYTGNAAKVSNSYFIIKPIQTGLKLQFDGLKMQCTSVCFVDNDLLIGTSNVPANMLCLTTAQCKDAEYLATNGFRIG